MALNTRFHTVLVMLVGLAMAAGSALATCPSDQEVALRAAGYLANQPLDGYAGDLSLADAYCAQAKYVARIAAAGGKFMGQPFQHVLSY